MDELKEAVEHYRAMFPGAHVFYREDGQEALIMVPPSNYIISVTADGSTSSATIDDNGWQTGFEA